VATRVPIATGVRLWMVVQMRPVRSMIKTINSTIPPMLIP
jgi:hypothetical protein